VLYSLIAATSHLSILAKNSFSKESHNEGGYLSDNSIFFLDAIKIIAKDPKRTIERIPPVMIFLVFLSTSDNFLFSQMISDGSLAGLILILPPKNCFNSLYSSSTVVYS